MCQTYANLLPWGVHQSASRPRTIASLVVVLERVLLVDTCYREREEERRERKYIELHFFSAPPVGFRGGGHTGTEGIGLYQDSRLHQTKSTNIKHHAFSTYMKPKRLRRKIYAARSRSAEINILRGPSFKGVLKERRGSTSSASFIISLCPLYLTPPQMFSAINLLFLFDP